MRRRVGRYIMHEEIASGGMATVHLGRFVGPGGFARTVAIKVLHPQFAKDPEFVAMFLDEARLAARVRHPNVVATLDVVALESELFLVMDYVQGESVSGLMRTPDGRQAVPPAIAVTIASDVLLGLHAAHEATDDQGDALSIVHRDISPQNVLVGVDGIARVVDFGVAKAAGRLQSTRDGQIKGKLSYMPPEQLRSEGVDRRADIYAAGVVLWEMLTGERLFGGNSPESSMVQVFEKVVEAPSSRVPSIPAALDEIVLRAVTRNASDRFATAREMATQLDDVMGRAPPTRIGDWVRERAHRTLDTRAARVARIESDTDAAPAEEAPRVPPEHPGTSTIADQASSLVTSSSDSGTPWTWSLSRTTITVSVVGALALTALTVGGYELGARRVAAGPAPSASAASVGSTSPASAPPPSTVASAPTSTPPPPTASPSAPPSKPVSRPRSAPSHPAAANCNPPFSIDANGYHVPKPECL